MDMFGLLFIAFMGVGALVFVAQAMRRGWKPSQQRRHRRQSPRIYDPAAMWTTTDHLTTLHLADPRNFGHHSGVDSSGNYDASQGWSTPEHTNSGEASYVPTDFGDGFGAGDAHHHADGASWTDSGGDFSGGGDLSGGGDFSGGGGDFSGGGDFGGGGGDFGGGGGDSGGGSY